MSAEQDRAGDAIDRVGLLKQEIADLRRQLAGFVHGDVLGVCTICRTTIYGIAVDGKHIHCDLQARLAEAQQARDNCNECAKALAAACDDYKAERDRANELLRRALTTLVDVTSSGGWDQACELHATIAAHLNPAPAAGPAGDA